MITSPKRTPQKKPKLDSFLDAIRSAGWEPGLSPKNYQDIISRGLRSKNLVLAAVAAEIACEENPLTLRSLFYRVVSAGILPNTDHENYSRLGRVLNVLRESGIVPFPWIVDNARSTLKPSSWSGLSDFLDTVKNAYRKDFWAQLPHYVHFFIEKDAIAGTVAPVTQEYDIALSPIRGYASLSFAHEIGDTWNQIQKPIHAFYLGDFDPSGMDIERDLRAKLKRYCTRPFAWTRLGVNATDFDDFDLIPLQAKKKDRRYQSFIHEHGHHCAEVDALPPTELRRRAREAIEQFIPAQQWAALKRVEATERETFNATLAKLGGVA